MRYQHVVSLNGNWRFRLDAEDRGELYEDDLVLTYQHDARWMTPEHDDSTWEIIAVPACWQAAGYDYNGVAWYRHRFVTPKTSDQERVRLRFKGVDYFADAWLNGIYLGSHEGYFAPFEFDVTEILLPENLLAVKVDSPNDANMKLRDSVRGLYGQKKLIKGALQDWDASNLAVNPGGIWTDVQALITGPVYVRGLRTNTGIKWADNLAKEAIVHVQVDLVSHCTAGPAVIRATILSHAGGQQRREEAIILSQEIAPWLGESTQQLTFVIAEPLLWWSWDLGEPNLYELVVEVLVGGELSDRVTERFGIREIHREGKGWETYLNGQRIFLRGTNYLSDQLLSTMTADRYTQDLDLMRKANLNTVRTFCVVERQEFYHLCDEMGIMVYQDFPIQWSMSDSSDLVRRATLAMQDMMHLLCNHPSVVIWCYGSEPGPKNFLKLGMALARQSRRLDPSRITHQANDCGLWDALEWRDKYGWLIDMHFYCGWYPYRQDDKRPHSEIATGDSPFDLEDKNPLLFELISEYGAQALPCKETLASFVDVEHWPPDWNRLSERCCQVELQRRVIPEPKGWNDFITHSQEYQAFLLKYHTEFYRRRKFSPCNGALQFLFNDCWPSITWSVVDYFRRPKLAYTTIAKAMRPLHVMMDWPANCEVNEKVNWLVVVVNDYPCRYDDLRVSWHISGSDGRIMASGDVLGAVDAQSLAKMDRIAWVAEAPGAYRVYLSLWQGSDRLSDNEYSFLVSRARDR